MARDSWVSKLTEGDLEALAVAGRRGGEGDGDQEVVVGGGRRLRVHGVRARPPKEAMASGVAVMVEADRGQRAEVKERGGPKAPRPGFGAMGLPSFKPPEKKREPETAEERWMREDAFGWGE